MEWSTPKLAFQIKKNIELFHLISFMLISRGLPEGLFQALEKIDIICWE